MSAADPSTLEQQVAALWGIGLTAAAFAVLVAIVGVMVARSARAPFPSSVITSLTILAALALIGYTVGGESRPELAAIAGTAVGALAGGVTALLSASRPRDDDDPPTPVDTP